jgi:hydrogenase maturation factor
MKNLVLSFFVLLLICCCSQKKSLVASAATDSKIVSSKKDTIRIANDSLEYEIIIIEPGFEAWLTTQKPRNYYSLLYLENHNIRFVTQWNNRVAQPYRYDPSLYEMRIDYFSSIHYGYEVNYLLYHYFMYFQSRYKQRL